MRNLVDGVEVASRTFGGNQQHAGQRSHVAVYPHVVRIDHAVAVDTESVVVEIRGHGEIGRILPDAVLAFLELAHARGVVAEFLAVEFAFYLLRGQEIAGHLDLHGLGSLIAEGDGTVSVDYGRLHGGAAPEGLLRMGRDAYGKGCKNNECFFHCIGFNFYIIFKRLIGKQAGKPGARRRLRDR